MDKTLQELLRQRAEKVVAFEQIVETAEGQARDLDDAEEQATAELKSEIAGLDKRLERAKEVARLKGEAAQPLSIATDSAPSHPREPAEKGLDLGCIVRSLAASKGIVPLAAQYAGETLKNDRVAKALSAGAGTAGGFLVPPDFVADIIELLRPASVVRSLNPIVMPMPTGAMSMPKLAGGAQASYIGENQNLPKTEPSFGQLQLTEKKLAALVPVSNDLLRVPGTSADAVVRDDLVAALGQAEDINFVRGTGSQYAPKGLRYWAAAANILAANGTINLANVTSDLGKLVLALMNGNVRFLRPGWIMAPRTFQYLMNVRDTNGNFAFRTEMFTGKLQMYPYRVTTQIPSNLGAGSDESELYLTDFADIIIGESLALELAVSDVAAYHDGSNVQAAFSLDQTVIRAITKHDLGCRHDVSIAVLTAVKWTP